MNASNRIWAISGSLIIVVVLVLAGLLGVLPQLAAANAHKEEAAGVETVNAQHRSELARLKDSASQIDAVSAEVAELRKSVAATTDLDSVIAELAALQAPTGVRISNYASADPVPFAPAAGLVAQVPPSINATNFLTTELQITVDGSRDAAFAFVHALQSSSRLYSVTDISSTAPTMTLLTIQVYTLLDTPLVDPAAAATTPPPAPDAVAAQ